MAQIYDDLGRKDEAQAARVRLLMNAGRGGEADALVSQMGLMRTFMLIGAFDNDQGKGFFTVLDPTGNQVYTRAGNFSINANGALVVGSSADGRIVQPAITFPQDTTGIVVSSDGKVSARQSGSTALNQIGQLQLVMFQNPEGLLKLGENLYSQTDASGAAQQVVPGLNGSGLVRQNALEASNVEPVQELIDLITTQRAFELNSQAVQAGDQILQLVSNLRRF